MLTSLTSNRQAWFDTRMSYNPAIHRTKQALFHGAIVQDLNTHPLPPPQPHLTPSHVRPQEMLKSTWDFPIFPELAAKIFAFICDELQHERFLNKQHLISEVGMKVCSHRFFILRTTMSKF